MSVFVLVIGGRRWAGWKGLPVVCPNCSKRLRIQDCEFRTLIHMEFLTVEAQTMIDVAGLTPALEAAGLELQRQIDERLAQDVEGVKRVPKDVTQKLRAFDSKLRARYEFRIEGMVIERLAPEAGGWVQVAMWPEDEGRVPMPIELVIETLGDGDMQKYRNAEAYLEVKRERAKKVREANARAADENIKERVDSLSRKQITQFLQAERALATGERIVAHGADEKFLDYAYLLTRRLQAEGKTDTTPTVGHFTRRARHGRNGIAAARRS